MPNDERVPNLAPDFFFKLNFYSSTSNNSKHSQIQTLIGTIYPPPQTHTHCGWVSWIPCVSSQYLSVRHRTDTYTHRKPPTHPHKHLHTKHNNIPDRSGSIKDHIRRPPQGIISFHLIIYLCHVSFREAILLQPTYESLEGHRSVTYSTMPNKLFGYQN